MERELRLMKGNEAVAEAAIRAGAKPQEWSFCRLKVK
jgi:pyruvate/2-oxoacid:ferredoxin oxidoreductase alpha subunit